MVEALRKQYVDVNAPLVAPENLLPDAYASTARGGKKVLGGGGGRGKGARTLPWQ